MSRYKASRSEDEVEIGQTGTEELYDTLLGALQDTNLVSQLYQFFLNAYPCQQAELADALCQFDDTTEEVCQASIGYADTAGEIAEEGKFSLVVMREIQRYLSSQRNCMLSCQKQLNGLLDFYQGANDSVVDEVQACIEQAMALEEMLSQAGRDLADGDLPRVLALTESIETEAERVSAEMSELKAKVSRV